MDHDQDAIRDEFAHPDEDMASGFELERGNELRLVRPWAGFEADADRPSEQGVSNLTLLYGGSRRGYSGEHLY